MPRLEALYTKATDADVTAPQVAGVTTPIIKTKTGKNLKRKKVYCKKQNILFFVKIIILKAKLTFQLYVYGGWLHLSALQWHAQIHWKKGPTRTLDTTSRQTYVVALTGPR